MKRNISIFYITLISLLTLFALPASSQSYDRDTLTKEDSLAFQAVEFSLLTCQPHDEVYSLYGHTAIRIVDPQRGADIVANWGVFDSSMSYFVLRFVFGLTDYMMGVLPVEIFFEEYRHYGCGVYQQRLNLSLKEKKSLMIALEKNYLPENRVYRYNFIYDNCTSRARDVIASALDGEIKYQPTEMQRGDRSFRELIHWKNTDYPWAAFGNDILLGVQADMNTDVMERHFLPEILMADYDSAKVICADGTEKALVDSAFWVLQPSPSPLVTMDGFPLTPLECSLIVLAIVALLCMFESFVLCDHLFIVDRIMFFIYGVIGILLTTMIFSQHPTVRINLQILVFCPLWLWLSVALNKWKQGYNVVLVCLILFFIGNILQSYAEGMNILALSLLLRVISSKRLTIDN